MCLIPRNSYNGAFYRAVFALHTENYQLAQQVHTLSVIKSKINLKVQNVMTVIVMELNYERIKNNDAFDFSALTKPEIF